jgi:hypothetical protein
MVSKMELDMVGNKRTDSFLQLAARSNVTLISAVGILAASMLSASVFFLFKNVAYFDDSFIYLHMAANIVEEGTARYFPIMDSGLLLSSSPLRLLTLVPGFAILDFFHIPLRSIEAARFDYLCSGFVAFLIFAPFWTNRFKLFLLTGTVFFLLGVSLDSFFLMEGGVLYFSLFTLVKLLTERSERYFSVGVAVLLVGLSRPEIGVAATISTICLYFHERKALKQFAIGLICAFLVYSILMFALRVYPIPSTIWSKQVTGKLKLFSDKHLIQVLPINLAHIMGLNWAWAGWILIALPAVLALFLKKGSIPILSALALLMIFAASMPGSFVWYSENFMVALFAIAIVVAIEIHRKGMAGRAALLTTVISVAFMLTLNENFGKVRDYPWNEHSVGYRAYEEVAKSSVGDGKFVIKRYSHEPVRLRMCEIGIVSYFAGPSAWLDDVCGLVQIGNLQGASKSLLRLLYPPSFGENGDDQLKRFKDDRTTPVIDLWALRSKEEAENAVGKCKFVDKMFCINEYK